MDQPVMSGLAWNEAVREIKCTAVYMSPGVKCKCLSKWSLKLLSLLAAWLFLTLIYKFGQVKLESQSLWVWKAYYMSAFGKLPVGFATSLH